MGFKQRLSLFFLFSLTVLVGGCQQAAERGELLSGEPAVVVPEVWKRRASVRVDVLPKKNSELHAGAYGIQQADGKIKCLLSKEEVPAKEKWAPLWLRFFTPAAPGKKFSSTFNDLLRFGHKRNAPEEISFTVAFEKGKAALDSAWRLVPYLSEKGGEPSCEVKVEICEDYQEEKDGVSCRGKWEWLSQIVGIGDQTAYLSSWGKNETLSGLDAIYYEVDGEGTLRETKPRPIGRR